MKQNIFCGSMAVKSASVLNVWGKHWHILQPLGLGLQFGLDFLRGVDRDMFVNMLWTLEKLRKTFFCCKMTNFTLRELEFSGNMYFNYPEK